ncbi:MAG: LD-carboxypeptidase [Bryobacteraceae bacterium]
MTRRNFLASSGIAPLTQVKMMAAPALIRPRPLRPGDTVGLITPSSFVSDPDRLATADRTIRYFGLIPKFGGTVRRKSGSLGGTVEERVNDLHAMFRDPEVAGVFAIRGGYGSAQLLDRIDYNLIRANPKVFLGYSDITAMHLAIQKKAGLITFHGPVPLSGFTEYTQMHFRRGLFQTGPLGIVTNPPESNALRPDHPLRVIRPGKARGPLAGGNLTLISTTLGTPYEIETRGRILLLEDVEEQPYSIDRMLTHLRLAGKLDGVAGIVFGECSDCRSRDFKPSFSDGSFSLGEVLDEILGKLNIPVLAGLTIGHTNDQLTLPLGVMATLDTAKGELDVE